MLSTSPRVVLIHPSPKLQEILRATLSLTEYYVEEGLHTSRLRFFSHRLCRRVLQRADALSCVRTGVFTPEQTGRQP